MNRVTIEPPRFVPVEVPTEVFNAVTDVLAELLLLDYDARNSRLGVTTSPHSPDDISPTSHERN